MGDSGKVLDTVHLAPQLMIFDRSLVRRRNEQCESGMEHMRVLADVL
jgi:hypothetical protein